MPAEMRMAEWSSRVLGIIGLAAMLIGAIDPLEGSVIILPGVGLLALAALVGKGRWRMLLYWALILVAIGVAAMWVLSALGGIGGSSGRSDWWGLLALPYAAGWVMGVVSGVLTLLQSFSRRKLPGQGEKLA
jgi:hypothetical protein